MDWIIICFEQESRFSPHWADKVNFWHDKKKLLVLLIAKAESWRVEALLPFSEWLSGNEPPHRQVQGQAQTRKRQFCRDKRETGICATWRWGYLTSCPPLRFHRMFSHSPGGWPSLVLPGAQDQPREIQSFLTGGLPSVRRRKGNFTRWHINLKFWRELLLSRDCK